MKSQIMQMGIGIAALSALAAEGKDFSREELNAMLDKLAASPEPKIRRGPMAMCYEMAMPQPERFEYVCKKCGTHTVYPENTNQMANELARRRDEAASLRALGLDITLDESVLCQKCSVGKEPGDGASADPERIYKLAWVINGKRTVVGFNDANILKAFLSGKKTWTAGDGNEGSLKTALPRLRKLLGVEAVK